MGHVATESTSTTSRRRRPRRPTPLQVRAIALIAVLAAAAAILGPPAPTGVSWIDAFYRAGFAVVLTLAGSRARRWSLIVASCLIAVSALGLALLAGAAALALSVFLVGRNRRDRVYGATVGGLLSVASMHLSLGLFVGSSALVCAVAVVVLGISGYRNTSRRVRRWWKVAMAVGAGVLACGSVAAIAAGGRAAGPLSDGVEAAQEGVRALQNADRSGASISLASATSRLAEASDRANSWWASVGTAVPVLSQNLRVVQGVARTGSELSQVARDLVEEVNYEELRLPSGGVDLAALESIRQPLFDALSALNAARSEVEALQSTWQLPPLATRFERFRRRVDELHHQTAIAALAVNTAPGLLGADGDRHYLVLLGDPAEARDLGGHLGNWAELDAVGGRLHLAAVGVPNDLRLASDPDSTKILSGLPPSLSEMKPLDFPQNWGSSPDMADVARLAAGLYQRRTGRTINGVMYADPSAFADFLAITGPIPMPALGRSLSRSDAVRFLTSGQFTEVARGSTADAVVTQLVHDVFDRLSSARLPGPQALSQLFRATVLQGRLKVYSFEKPDQPLLAALDIDGVLSIPDHGDALGVINRNANPSKIDTYLHRSTTVDVRWDPETGEIHESVVVTLRNDAPATGLPQVVIGNQAGLPFGTNLTDLALLTRYELTDVSVDGSRATSRPQWDGRYWRNTVRVALPPGGTSIVRFELQGGLEPSDEYSVFFIGQPLVNEGDLTLRVTPNSGKIAAGHGVQVGAGGATVRLHDGHDTLVNLRLKR